MKLLLIVLLILSVARARQEGATWLAIIACSSRVFNFLAFGRIDETFSSRTGREVLCETKPVWFWKSVETVLNLVFRGLEKDHCFASRMRKLSRLTENHSNDA